MKYEVRCCCKPQKLLGWIDGLPEGLREVVLPVAGRDLVLPIATFGEFETASAEDLDAMVRAGVMSKDKRDAFEEMPEEMLTDEELDSTSASLFSPSRRKIWRYTCRAIKAEETPIETLRLIPGFIENHKT